jgi:zinc protease
VSRFNNFIITAFLIVVLIFSGALPGDLSEMEFEKYELPNGLDVILYEDHSIPMVTVNILYHVGSKNEKPGRTGFAHLFEHMMFQGSEHFNRPYSEGIVKYGGRRNGGTNSDLTMYYENMPSNYLEKTLWLEADRMGYLLPAVVQERFDTQISVVTNEKKQRYDDQPYGKVQEIYRKLIFPANHPYSWTTIGRVEDLEAATLEDVHEFFKTYYTPSNASLCIAGDFNPADAKKWVENYFGPISAGPAIERMKQWVPVLSEEIRATVEDNVSLPRLYMVWHTPPQYAPGHAEFELLTDILGDGKTSRLYSTLVYDLQIAQDIKVSQVDREIGCTFHITVTAKDGHTLEEIESEIDILLAELLTNGVSPNELERVKASHEADFIRKLQYIGGFNGRAARLNEYNTFLGDPAKLVWDKDRYTNVTTDDILSYVRDFLKPSSRLVLYVVPFGEKETIDILTDMAIEPGSEAEPDFTPPEIQTASLSNGMEIYLVEDHELPLVQLNLVIKSGWAADPSKRPGAASLTAELLNEGTKNRNALDISDEVRRLGAKLNSTSYFDNSSVELNVLKKNLDQALDLMADVVLNPTFPEEELQRQKEIYLGKIQQESQQPYPAAFNSFLRELYGEDHPYGQPYTGSGTKESITAITRSDIIDYFKANYLPNNTTAIVVGDITLNEAKSKIEKVFKKWEDGTVVASNIKEVSPIDKTTIFIVDKPGAAQSTIAMGNLIGPRNSPDFLPLDIAGKVLGGGSIARLYMNLRQEKGYTYGAFTDVIGRQTQGVIVNYARIQVDATGESVLEFIKEIRGITGEIPITESELSDVKNNEIKGFPQDFQTLAGIANKLEKIITYGLPLDEWDSYVSRVNAIDVQKAQEIAAKNIFPDALLIVVVGDRDKIESQIRELNLGEIIVSSTN